MSILLRRLSASLALLALALCVPQGSLTLCASEDGHLALEATCEPGSMPAHAEQHAGVAKDHCDCDGGCGPCQDAQVGTELSAGRTRDFGHASNLVASPAPIPAAFAAALPRAPEPVRRTAPALAPDPFARVQAGACLRL